MTTFTCLLEKDRITVNAPILRPNLAMIMQNISLMVYICLPTMDANQKKLQK